MTLKINYNNLITKRLSRLNHLQEILEDKNTLISEKQYKLDCWTQSGKKKEAFLLPKEMEIFTKIVQSYLYYSNEKIKNLVYQHSNLSEIALASMFIVNKIYFMGSEISYSHTDIALKISKELITTIMMNRYLERKNQDIKYLDWFSTFLTILDTSRQLELGYIITNSLCKLNKLIVDDSNIDKGMQYLKFDVDASNIVLVDTLPRLVIPQNFSSNKHILYDTLGFEIKLIHASNNNMYIESNLSNEFVNSVNILQNTKFNVNHTILNSLLNEYNEEIIKDVLDGDELYLESIHQSFHINKKNSTKQKKDILSDFKKSEYKVLTFIDTLCVAYLLRNYDFYFSTYSDWRGRKYFLSYPLNPTNSKISRKILNFGNNKNIISLDANASGFSILGMLTGDISISTLIQTNIFKKEKEDLDVIRDLYSDILKELENDKTFFALCENKTFLTRKDFKYIAMCYVYSESNWSRQSKIENSLQNSGLTFSKTKIYEISQYIGNFIKNTKKELYLFIDILILLVDVLINKKRPNIYINCIEKYIQLSIVSYVQESKQIRIKINNKWEKKV